MNRIVVDNESKIVLSNNIFDLEINNNELEIVVDGKVLINEIDTKSDESINITIVASKNSTLVYNRYINHKVMNNKINIVQENDSDVTLNYSFMAQDKCNLEINSSLLGDNNKTAINVRAITKDDGKCYIKSTADVKERVKDNELMESIKIVTLNDEEQVIIPNLLVSSNEVVANHAATISSIDPEYMFYLNSKGINEKDAKRIITKGFLLSNLMVSEEIKNLINEML